MIQKTKWGYIDWWYLSEDGKQDSRSMNVGMTYILPGKRQLPHVHYGHEQMLYVLEGHGIYLINGEYIPFRPGMHFYMAADTLHDTINTGDTMVRELLISNPVRDTMLRTEERAAARLREDGAAPQVSLYAAVEAVREHLLGSTRLPFTIFDEDWNIVLQNPHFPAICMERCDPVQNGGACACLQPRTFDTSRTSSCIEFACPHGMTVYHLAILFHGKCIGTVRGGHFFSSEAASQDSGEIYDSPRTTGIGVRNLMLQMLDGLLSYCELSASRELFNAKERALKQIEQKRIILEQDLTAVKDTVTNLKINHHFLFNTLNCMAGMALTGERIDLYTAIINLAKMFRYTMTTDLRFVSLDAELEYLRTYLDLQGLRYGERLRVSYEVEDDCRDVLVPFNFLQPIVENAFTHGFMNSGEEAVLRIVVEADGSHAVIRTYNNGSIPDGITVNRVNKSLSGDSGHGLHLIYEKLRSAYGEDFSMDMEADAEQGICCVRVRLPATYEEGEGAL